MARWAPPSLEKRMKPCNRELHCQHNWGKILQALREFSLDILKITSEIIAWAD